MLTPSLILSKNIFLGPLCARHCSAVAPGGCNSRQDRKKFLPSWGLHPEEEINQNKEANDDVRRC